MNNYQVQTLQLRQTLQLSILKQKNANFTQTFQLSTNKQRIPIALYTINMVITHLVIVQTLKTRTYYISYKSRSKTIDINKY